MIVARTQAELAEAIDTAVSDRPGRVAFVPTMGSLHEGHLSLVRHAGEMAAVTVASIYVNPSQFGPGEDFNAYPRQHDRDAELLTATGCDILFLPTTDEVYPSGFATKVLASSELAEDLCGAVRGRSHFDGVATVVARLFGLVMPDIAWFGEKDWQQLLVIRRMTADLYPKIEIASAATVRDEDGLALSSRNSYLNATERRAAEAVPNAIRAARRAARRNASPSSCAEQASAALLAAGIQIEYVEIRRGDDLGATNPDAVGDDDRIFIAGRIGATRLIDNASLTQPIPNLDEHLPTPMASAAEAAATS